MSQLSERHEVRVRGEGQTIVFIADSQDDRLVIRQEADGKNPKDVTIFTRAIPSRCRR